MTKNRKKGATLVELCIVLLLSAIVVSMVVTLMIMTMNHTEENRARADSMADFTLVESNLKRWIRHYDNYDYAIMNAQICDIDGKYAVLDEKGEAVIVDGEPLRRSPSERDASGKLYIGTDKLTVQFGAQKQEETGDKNFPVITASFYYDKKKSQIIGEYCEAQFNRDGTPKYDANGYPVITHDTENDIVIPVDHIDGMEFYIQQSVETGKVLICCVLSYHTAESDEIKTCELKYATHAQSVIARKTGQGKVVITE